MGAFGSYHDFSIHGDDRWYRASSWTRWAPVVVIWIFLMSVVEVVLGAIWLVQLRSQFKVSVSPPLPPAALPFGVRTGLWSDFWGKICGSFS